MKSTLEVSAKIWKKTFTFCVKDLKDDRVHIEDIRILDLKDKEGEIQKDESTKGAPWIYSHLIFMDVVIM